MVTLVPNGSDSYHPMHPVLQVARKITHILLILRVQLLFPVLYLSLISLVRLCVNDSEFDVSNSVSNQYKNPGNYKVFTIFFLQL